MVKVGGSLGQASATEIIGLNQPPVFSSVGKKATHKQWIPGNFTSLTTKECAAQLN